MADDLDSYTFTLGKQAEEQARKELNEIPKERVAAMKTFRDWILQQKDWFKCPTDAKHLLMFLRNKKFVQLKAREKIIKYWTAHLHHPQFFHNLDPRDPSIEQVFKDGIFIPLPGYDSQGRKLGMARWGKVDTSGKRYSADDIMRAIIIFDEYLLSDEQTQVAGFVTLEDLTGFSLQHSAFLGIDMCRKMTTISTKAMPLRFKGFHTYNNNPVFEAIFAVVKPLMSKKIVDRFHLHGKSLTTVYEHMDKQFLPVEYLPDNYDGPNAGTLNKLIEHAVEEFQKPNFREYLLNKSKAGYGVDETKKPPDSELFNESFRRLHVD